MKKLFAMILCLGLTAGLLACGGESGEESLSLETTVVEPQQTETESAEVTKETREEKVVVDGDGKILRFGGEKVTVWLVGDAGKQEGVTRVMNSVREYFLDQWNIDVTICFQKSESYGDKINLLLTEAEDCDIFCSGLAGFYQAVDYGLCYDLYQDNLIQTYGTDILKKVGSRYLEGCESWGGLYGVPSFGKQAVTEWCVAVKAEYLRTAGCDLSAFDAESVNPVTAEELTAMFAELKAEYPDQYMIYPGDYGSLCERILYDPLGGDDFGVLLDPENSLEVADLFSSELFRTYCELMRSWETRGFIAPDVSCADDGAEAVAEGRVMACAVSGVPGVVEEAEKACGADMLVFSLGENFVHSEQVVAGAWSIDSLCRNPEAAMVVLNALYSDAEVINTLYYGDPDLDYAMTPEGSVTFPQNVTAENCEYYRVWELSWLPCSYGLYVSEEEDTEIREKAEAFNSSAAMSQAIGFSFQKYDPEVAAEYTALSNAVSEAAEELMFGRAEVSEGIARLQAELSEAGLGAYMAEKKNQFDDWCARMAKTSE